MATEWQIGDKIQDRWEIHRILRGGMGIVYIVYDHRLYEPYAAKTYQDEIFACSPQISERFSQEALTWVNLDIHLNITRALRVEIIQGKPFLFLEYVSGGDLSRWIGTPRLTKDLPQVLRFAIHFCDGMSHALSKGIRAHRDIKPQNCLVTEDHTLKVTDFGLVKIFDNTTDWPEGELASNVKRLEICHTQTGTGAGTAPYMAPEQFEDVKHVGVPADIYAFGVMLYEMMTGRLPFRAGTLRDFERLHKTQSPVTDHIKPESLRGVIETCLRKDPKRRFSDFSVLRQRLGDFYENLTQSSAPQPVSGIDLDVDDLTNKGLSLNNLGRTEEALSFHNQALELNPRDKMAWSNKGVALADLGRPEEALVCYDQALKLDPRFEQAWCNKGLALADLGRTEEALSCYDQALELNPRLEQAWYNKGVTLADLGRAEEALLCYDPALELNPQFEQAWCNKGLALVDLGRPEEALACYDQALKLNPRLEEAWLNKGNALNNLGRIEEALACYDQALELNPRDEDAWSNKGVALAGLGRTDEALFCFDQALELNPRDETAWSNKGVALAGLDRYEEAFCCFDQVLELNPRDKKIWYKKGATLGILGRYKDALFCFEEAQRLGHPQTAEAIALCRQQLGQE